MSLLKTSLILVAIIALSLATKPAKVCRFAPRYKTTELLENPMHFLQNFVEFEK
jgi:hypothetical protein